MKVQLWLKNFWNSFPIQLLLLHVKKHQLILVYWGILFAVITGNFMNTFGAKSLFLAPEYLGKVSFTSNLFLGIALGVFVMSWNITTFILFSRHFKFLAAAEKPFLIYCLNNFLIPSSFLALYLYKMYSYLHISELFSITQTLLGMFGFALGVTLLILLSFIYFFRADSTIQKYIQPILSGAFYLDNNDLKNATATSESKLINVTTYLASIRKVNLVRLVKHYNKDFIEKVFSRHHLAGLFLMLLAFFVLIISSFFLDTPFFQLPAAASITVFFALLLALFGALAYLLQNWSLPFTIGVVIVINLLFKYNIIDPTNKAYGLTYTNKEQRPQYTEQALKLLCTNEQMQKDSLNMIEVLNNWKANQNGAKPNIYFVNVSGGGSRSASFTMHVMQTLDSIMHKSFLQKTFMIHGASGGMLGAAYYRQLHLEELNGNIKSKNNETFAEQIGNDLLNPIFSSFVARDLLSPIQKFDWQGQSYIKDRGYAFEQKLNEHTNNIMQKPLSYYQQWERKGKIPLMIYSSVVTRDARKMLINTQPISFLMKSNIVDNSIDAVDFGAFFKKQNALQLSQLTALRMNATFPYVLPAVWLPSNPVIDVMDAGIRDNFGQEMTLRFIQYFKTWLSQNVNKIIIIGIRDRPTGNWDLPFENNNLSGLLTKPITQMQYNIFKMQDYHQEEMLQSNMQDTVLSIEKMIFAYQPSKKFEGASLSFHLTKKEKQSIKESVWNDENKKYFKRIKALK